MNILNANWIRTGRAFDGTVEGLELELEESRGYFFRGKDLELTLLVLMLLLPLIDALEEVELSSSVVALPSSFGVLSAGLFVFCFCFAA